MKHRHEGRSPSITARFGCPLFLAAIASFTAVAGAQGMPWKHPDGTTHWYEAVAVPGGISWDAASLAANAAGGYLATITSSQENDFVFALIDDPAYWAQDQGPWLGGMQLPGAVEPGGGWAWSELEPFGYQSWALGKPDDHGGADRIRFGGGTARVNTWADEVAATPLLGFVIERSGPTVPSTIGTLQHDAGALDGYTLFAPVNSTITYLIDMRGRVVHSWTSSYGPGLSCYLLPNGNLLRAGRIGNATFTVGGVGGVIEEYDWDGNPVWSYRYSTATVCQHHDIERLPNGNTLLIAWELKTQQEAIAAGRDPALLTNGVLYPDHVLEVQPTGPTTGQIVWEWHLWDHLVQDFDSQQANYGVVAQHPELVDINYPPAGQTGGGINDWMHSNAINYNAALDQIVISVRHFSELWVIDHSTTTAEAASHSGGRSHSGGDLLYRWGNPAAYRGGTTMDRKLFNQHDVHWIPPALPGGDNLLVFNNGVDRPGTEFTTVVELTPPKPTGNGSYPRMGAAWGPQQPTWEYQATNPASFYSRFVGGAQRLANGNTLICSGWTGESFEVDAQSQTVWRYECPVGFFGSLLQGEPPTGNQVFRSPRYEPSYGAFSGRTLTPGDPIELHTMRLLADGAVIPLRAPVGAQVTLSVISVADAGRFYLVGTSATPGVTAVDSRFLRVGQDPLLIASMTSAAPSVFQSYFGTLDTQGRATATLAIPPEPTLAGLDLYSTFVVVDFSLVNGVAALANGVTVKIVP